MSSQEESFLEYALSDDTVVYLQFPNVNDRDGCHISLDMYKAQLGPVTKEVLMRILEKFHGHWLQAPETK